MKIKPILIIFIFVFATSCKYDKKANTNHKQAIPTDTNSHDWGYDGNTPLKIGKKTILIAMEKTNLLLISLV
ncbi:hypothetical protein [Tenacibaculum maritimum]|uniref:hypothetical protein n=1 Tax=Tenacibaculum maritimum TaxID=107401 RepID=UPI001E43A024|nr:hypothetical protein [Tenacibaculum maritimum]MCD9562701.1 hypothetical protein [Tenacibaculum maritimum]MCD9564763.1 hypothetical protein [Tenacibaculum maritimum]MCD9577892.1 hypothetical protein [Tenacibaculum maritimum]MCD9596776.1 hypothetical protein [Tenacibaculum maritimum]MCD9610276.1 hypothetical protein [Tenacibaculum maritimum]